MEAGFDVAAFAAVQAKLSPMWPGMTLRRRDEERTLLVVSSVNFAVPDHVLPLLPAYEERYLGSVLSLAQAPRTRVIYVTSQPMLPRLLDYYLRLIPGIDHNALKSRLFAVSVGDWSPRPLTQKILERPRLVQRLRDLIQDPDHAVILPFSTGDADARLAIELGVPLYGPDPRLGYLGSKTGSRQVFLAAGVPHPGGVEGVRTVADLVDAIDGLRSKSDVREVVVKLDTSVSGLGNAIVDLRGADRPAEVESRIRRLQPEDASLAGDDYLAQLEADGGIVEERVTGDDFCSPSVQLRASPEGEVEVLTTHDQVLGGPQNQTYFGCRFPANRQYAALVAEHGMAVGRELADRGVIGRFGVDFVATRAGGTWSASAIEINLRSGGTTHPYLALLALTEGEYEPATARFAVDGIDKYYVATDHLEVPGLRSLTPDDVLDVVDEAGFGWSPETKSGLVFHMLSGVAVAGRVGVTAIADSPDDAGALYTKVESALTTACR